MAKRESMEEAEARLKKRAEKKAKKCMIFYSGKDPVQVERPEREGAIHLLPMSQKEMTEADLDTLEEAKVNFVRVAFPKSRYSPFGSKEKPPLRLPSLSVSSMVEEDKTFKSDPSQSLSKVRGSTKKKK